MGSGQQQTSEYSKNYEEGPSTRDDALQQLWNIWQQADLNLTRLAETEDNFISLDQQLPDGLEKEIEDAINTQDSIINDLLQTRAASLGAICVKLNIWLAHKFPGQIDLEQLSPSDRLIYQAIRELNKIRKKLSG